MEKNLYCIRLSESVSVTEWMTPDEAKEKLKQMVKLHKSDAELLVYDKETKTWNHNAKKKYD